MERPADKGLREIGNPEHPQSKFTEPKGECVEIAVTSGWKK